MTWTIPADVASVLEASHYLGPSKRGFAWSDQYGVIVVAAPTARNLPPTWLELVRWCILSEEKNAGSKQWAAFVRALKARRPDATTLVSYSDPSVGHTGALYRACNWLWAPTWHRLRPPPTGNGKWGREGKTQAVKDRWVFVLGPDETREDILRCKDGSILRRLPWAEYREPAGVSFKRWKEYSGDICKGTA